MRELNIFFFKLVADILPFIYMRDQSAGIELARKSLLALLWSMMERERSSHSAAHHTLLQRFKTDAGQVGLCLWVSHNPYCSLSQRENTANNKKKGTTNTNKIPLKFLFLLFPFFWLSYCISLFLFCFLSSQRVPWDVLCGREVCTAKPQSTVNTCGR